MKIGKMKTKPIIDIEKALQEKEIMQKHFIRENGYKSSIFELLINHFKDELKKKKEEIKNDS